MYYIQSHSVAVSLASMWSQIHVSAYMDATSHLRIQLVIQTTKNRTGNSLLLPHVDLTLINPKIGSSFNQIYLV